jgi:hypothetical protein
MNRKANGKDHIKKLNEIDAFIAGAKSAFGFGLLQEFGDGGTGVVEVHYKKCMPVKVVVRSYIGLDRFGNVRGLKADWELTPQDLAEELDDVCMDCREKQAQRSKGPRASLALGLRLHDFSFPTGHYPANAQRHRVERAHNA